jgi:hypothetical protein
VRAQSRKYNPTTRRLPTPRDHSRAFYPLCKSMQNNAAVLPAQSDADVACTRIRVWAGTNDAEQVVKLRHIYHSAPTIGRLFRVRCNTRGEKRRSRQASTSFTSRRARPVLTFSRGTILRERRSLLVDKGKTSISGALFARFTRNNLNNYDRISFVDSCGSPTQVSALGINDRTRNTSLAQRGLFLCLISPVAAA